MFTGKVYNKCDNSMNNVGKHTFTEYQSNKQETQSRLQSIP